MDLAAYLAQSQVRFVVGKGGVGKTTLTAALGLAGASLGRRVQLIELDGRDELARCFDVRESLEFVPATLYESASGGRVDARHLAADASLTEWLSEHGFGRLLAKLRANGALDVIATSVPGMRDVLVLGKIKALAREFPNDVFLVDAPATGHSLSMLAAPASLVRATQSGPIRRQAEDVDAMLRDETRCAVTLVTVAADLPVTEAIEASFDLEDRAGVSLSVVLVNQCDPLASVLHDKLRSRDLEGLDPVLARSVQRAGRFARAHLAESEHQRKRLARSLPLPQIVVPRLHTDIIGLDELTELAKTLLSSSWP